MTRVKSTASHSPEALRKTCLGVFHKKFNRKGLLGSTPEILDGKGGVGKTSCSEQRFFQDSCCARRYGCLYMYLVPVQVAKNDESSTHLNMSPFIGSLLAGKWHLGEGSSAIRQGSSNHGNGRFGGAGRVSVCSGISIDFHCILLSLLRHQSFARLNHA